MRTYYTRKSMAKRRLVKRRMLTLRVTVPDFDDLTRWARADAKDRADILRGWIEREREERLERQRRDREEHEERQRGKLDHLARVNAGMAA